MEECICHFYSVVNGLTELHSAVYHLHHKCVERLLKAGADVSIENLHGCNLLNIASRSAKCVALLIAAYPAGVFVVNKWGGTLLHNAAWNGKLEVCSLLLIAGCNVNAVDNDGRTPLWWALCNNNRNVAELLLDHGAHLEYINLEYDLKSIPEWALKFAARRNACAKASRIVTSLTKPGMDRHLFKMLGKYVWATRKNKNWEK